MKRIKCKKCGSSFKDRNDPKDKEAIKTLCWNCRFIWNFVDVTLTSLDSFKKINRTVAIKLDDIIIRKKIKRI